MINYKGDHFEYMEYMDSLKDIPCTPLPDLKTGEGHGHFRPTTREHPKKSYLQHKRNKRKLAKASRRRNRS